MGELDRALLIAVLSLLLAVAGAAGQGTEAGVSVTPEATDWDRLRRPLDLPTLAAGEICPRSEGIRVTPDLGFGLGDGPVYPAMGPDGVLHYGAAREEGGWFYHKVLWFATPDYAGAILVRGGQLDGPNEVRFEQGSDPPAELRLPGSEGTIGGDPDLRGWPSYTRLRAPGCYAYQVDGLDFSDLIVFHVVEEQPDEMTPLPTPEDGENPLPRELGVESGVRLGADQVRLALIGDEGQVVRLDVWPTQDAALALPGRKSHRLETVAGVVLWQAHPEHGWPQVATWDDGRRRYRLEVLDGGPDDWSEADLVTLVEAFAEAPEPDET